LQYATSVPLMRSGSKVSVHSLAFDDRHDKIKNADDFTMKIKTGL